MENVLIKQSHQRCLSKNISHSFVSSDRVNDDFDKQLNSIVWNCIRNIRSSFFALFNTFFTLSNKELVVINHFLNKNSNVDMSKYIPPIGASLKEEDYGTSATCIASLKGDVAYVIKKEHFIKRSCDLTCVAAPFRVGRDIVGYISLSSLDSRQVNALRVFIESFSINIENELKKSQIKKLMIQNLNENNEFIMNDAVLDFLTPTEREAIKYIFKNFSNEMIAQSMYISETAVRKTLLSIYKKVGTNNKIDTMVNIIYKDILSFIQ